MAAEGLLDLPQLDGHRAGERGFRRASLAIFLSGIAVFAMLYVPQVLLPELSRAFRVSSAAATLAVSVATAGLAVGLLVLGPVSDRRGRTAILHASLAISSVLAVVLARTGSFPAAFWVTIGITAVAAVAALSLPGPGQPAAASAGARNAAKVVRRRSRNPRAS